MKRAGALTSIAVGAASVLALALSAAGTHDRHDRALVALRQVSQSEPEPPRPPREEAIERRPRALRQSPRGQDQKMLMLLLLMEMGSSTSRR